MSEFNLLLNFEATPPFIIMEDENSDWLYRLKLDQKPTFKGRGKKRMLHFFIDRVIWTK